MTEMIKIAEVKEHLRQEIKNFETVQDAFVYGGNFEEKDFDYFKGSVEYGTTCLIVNGSGKPYFHPNKRTILEDVNFIIFVIGVNDINDEDVLADSQDCLKTIDELKSFIFGNNFGFAEVIKNNVNEWRPIENTIDKEKRISIYMLDFNLTFKSGVAINQNF